MSEYPKVVWLQTKERTSLEHTSRGITTRDTSPGAVLVFRETPDGWHGVECEKRREHIALWSKHIWEEVQP